MPHSRKNPVIREISGYIFVMREYLHQWLRSRSSLIVFALPLLLATMGPFGTYSDLTFLPRLFYWAVLVYGVGICMIVSNAYFLSVQRRFLNQVLGVLVGSAIAAIPGALLVYLLRASMRPQALNPETFSPLQLWAEVWILGVIISFAEIARVKFFEQYDGKEALLGTAAPLSSQAEPLLGNPTNAIRTQLHAQLDHSTHQPEDIISLSMQDHYVAVTSDQGVSLVLMRMVDAVDALDGLHGFRIHRSHWVASSHMRSLSREQKRVFLTLSDGRKLPVSKTYLPDVTAALGVQDVFA